MPKIERWITSRKVCGNLIDRMRGRAISIANLNQLRLWVDTNPEVPEGIEFGGPRSYKTMFANV